MPLITLENLDISSAWGLWEIQENPEALASILHPGEELASLSAVHSQQKKSEKIAARLVLSAILNHWGMDFKGTEAAITRKPFLREYPYHISISHSHQKAVAIVKKNEKIGIDIELISEKIVKIGPRVFSAEELRFSEGNPEILTTLWTIKEVLYKINGERGVDFIRDLFIPPFDYQPAGGFAQGILRTNFGKHSFIIRYLKHGNHIISFNC